MEQHDNLVKILFLRHVMKENNWDEETISEIFYITTTYLHLLLRGQKPISKKIFEKCVANSTKSIEHFKVDLDKLNLIPFMNQLENPDFKEMVSSIMFSIKLKNRKIK